MTTTWNLPTGPVTWNTKVAWTHAVLASKDGEWFIFTSHKTAAAAQKALTGYYGTHAGRGGWSATAEIITPS